MKTLKFICTWVFLFLLIKPTNAGELKMDRIKIGLGKNIVDTAKSSGVPNFSAGNVDGLIQYKVMQIPEDLPIIFSSPAGEIRISPVFALSIYADRHRTPDDRVTTAVIQVAGRGLKNHADAKIYLRQIVSQFNNSAWKRYIPSHCPAVSGRSSALDMNGKLGNVGCPLDPEYEVDADEWKILFKRGQSYEWLSGEIHAKLEASYGDYGSGPNYHIFLTFENYFAMLEVNKENMLRSLKEGDAKGWNSTTKALDDEKSIAIEVKELEAKAVARGDKIVNR